MKLKAAQRRMSPPVQDGWKFSLTVRAYGHQVTVRGAVKTDPDSPEDAFVTVTNSDGEKLTTAVCWDMDEALMEAASQAGVILATM